jgi:hypothetical protein
MSTQNNKYAQNPGRRCVAMATLAVLALVTLATTGCVAEMDAPLHADKQLNVPSEPDLSTGTDQFAARKFRECLPPIMSNNYECRRCCYQQYNSKLTPCYAACDAVWPAPPAKMKWAS